MRTDQTFIDAVPRKRARDRRPAFLPIVLLSLAAVVTLATATAQAEDILYSDELIEKLDVREKLDTREPEETVRTRGLIKVPATSPAPAATDKSDQSRQSIHSVILKIGFAYNSSDLSGESIGQLNELGKALDSRQLGQYRFEIAGHTDASGSGEYNRDLSYRRAESVKRFLCIKMGIDPERLVTRGWGEDRPISEDDPYNPDNRRVEIINIGSSE
jgi:outer membrane protein OmpA-like peptidoglycan-associated protein